MATQREMVKPQVARPETMVGNIALYLIGLGFLALNKISNRLKGYRNPRTFSMSEFRKAVEYDTGVVEHWLEVLRRYKCDCNGVEGKVVLELGPGADLGVGLTLLSKRARKYHALDVNNLVKTVPQEFYEELFRYLEKTYSGVLDVEFLRRQLALTNGGGNDRLNYICARDFDVTRFKSEGIDLVFSQAAFEHFDNMNKTIEQLSGVVKKSGVLVAEVDLKTHTRWIRDVDPLNIYRYSDFIYNIFRYPGLPNRLRPVDYQKMLEKNGWENIRIFPLVVLDEVYLAKVRNLLYKKFHAVENEMASLSVMICATKGCGEKLLK